MANATKIENYYEILGVSNTATADQIKASFRQLSHKWHPDKFGDKSDAEKKTAEAQFKKINNAYEVLSDPTQRESYDIKIGLKVVTIDAPFDHIAWSNWANECISSGNIGALSDYVLDPKQPKNIRGYVVISLFNYYYASEQYDAIYALAKNPNLSFVKKEALIGLVKGYVKQVKRKGNSIPFYDGSSTVSSRWHIIGNPFDQFDSDSISYASREVVAYLFTAKRSTSDAKMVDYGSLHTIATNPVFPDTIRTLAAVGDQSDRSGRFPGLVEVYTALAMADRLIDLSRSPNLDYSSRVEAGTRAVNLMHDYAVSSSSTPLYYLNILYALANSSNAGNRVVEEVRSNGVTRAIEVAKTALVRTSATIHVDRLFDATKDPNVDEKTKATISDFIKGVSIDIQYAHPVREYAATAAIRLFSATEDWSSLSELAKSPSLNPQTRRRAVGALLDLSRTSSRIGIRNGSLNAAIDCFASLGDTQALYDIAANTATREEFSKAVFVTLVSLYKSPKDVVSIDQLLTNPKFEKLVPEVLDDVLKYYVAANHYDGVMTLAIRDYPQEKRTAAAKAYLDAVYRNPAVNSSDLICYASLNQFTPDARNYAVAFAMDKIDEAISRATSATDISSDLSVAREVFSASVDDSLKTRARSQYAKLLRKSTDAHLLMGVAKDPLFEESDRVECAGVAVEILKQTSEGIGVLVEISKANNLPKEAKAVVVAAIPAEFRGEEYYKSVLDDADASKKDKSEALKSLVAIYEKSENTGALLVFATSDVYGANTRKHCAKKAIEVYVRRKNYSDLVSLETNPGILADSKVAAHEALIGLISGETNPNAIPASLYDDPTSDLASLVLGRCKVIASDPGFAVESRNTAASIVIGIFAKLADPSVELLEFSKAENLPHSSLNAIAGELCKLNSPDLVRIVDSPDYPVILRLGIGRHLVSISSDSGALYALYANTAVPDEIRVAAGLKMVDSNAGSFDDLYPLAASQLPSVKRSATGAVAVLVDAHSLNETQLGVIASNSNLDLDLRNSAGFALVRLLEKDLSKTYLLVDDASLPTEVRTAAANSCISDVISDAKIDWDYDRLLSVAQNPFCSSTQRDASLSAFVDVVLSSNSPDQLTRASRILSGNAKTKVDDALSLISLKSAGSVDDLIIFAKDGSKPEDLRSFAVGAVCDIYSTRGAVDLLLPLFHDSSLPSSTSLKVASAIATSQNNFDLRLKELLETDRTDALFDLMTDDRLTVSSQEKAASAFLKSASSKGEFRSIVDSTRSGMIPDSISQEVGAALLASLEKSSETAALASGDATGMVKLLEIADAPKSVRLEIGRRIVDSLSTKKDRNGLNDLLDQAESKVPDYVKSLASTAISKLDVLEVAQKPAPRVDVKSLLDGVVVTTKRKL